MDPNSWSELPRSLVVDSGAGETVIPVDWCKQYPIRESQGQRDGDFYTAANGDIIYPEGEKLLTLCSMDGSQWRQMKFQLAKVGKALGSVSQIVRHGNRVLFASRGSYIENVSSGERLWLE